MMFPDFGPRARSEAQRNKTREQFRADLRAAAPGTPVIIPEGFPHAELMQIAQEISRERGQQKAEPAWKQDGGKPRMDLIAPEMLVGTANVLAYGAAKYAERNWEKGMSWGRVFGALMRHMWAWWGGEKTDAETGYSHLWHASACLMFLVAYEERKIGTDDREIAVDND